jgi:hypothetical protein
MINHFVNRFNSRSEQMLMEHKAGDLHTSRTVPLPFNREQSLKKLLKEMSTMSDIKIPENEWPQFCEGFTRQHHGWLIGMRQLNTAELQRDEASGYKPIELFTGNRSLQEIRQGYKDGLVEIMVTVGEGLEETSFLIEDIVALYRRKVADAHQGLRIDSNNGTTTLIEFRVAAEPEALDGLAKSEQYATPSV